MSARPAACALALLLAGVAGAHEAHQPDAALPLGYGPLQFEAPAPGTYALPPLGPAGDGQVLDTNGGRVRLHELYRDRIVLLAFVYTSCADVGGCPLALAVMEQIKTRLEADPALAAGTRLLTLSFDPERDTPEVMRAYGSGFRLRSADWRFLTTSSEDELAPILAAYGQPIQSEVGPGGRPTGRFSHLLRVVLIDREKRIRNIYSSSFLHADLVLADIRTLWLDASPNGARGARAVAEPSVDLLALADRPPLGLPEPPVPHDNPLTRAKVELGRKLFLDRRLSHNGTMSCAMCHIPEQGFTNHELATAVGIEGRTVRRNAPSVYNVAYVPRLFHDGREGRLERQVWGPLLASNEMGNPSPGRVIERIESLPDYAGLFERAFDGRGADMQTLGMALASYQRALLLGNSAFDRWHFGGERDALSAAAARGFDLFVGKAACVTCHSIGAQSALFTDHGMRNTGVGFARAMGAGPRPQRVQLAPGVTTEISAEQLASISETPPGDLGLYELTLDPADRWKYRTPSLRNVALTPPYMHDGSLRTLRAVVEFYDRGGVPNETLDPAMRPLGLSAREIDDLVAFLEALTGEGAALLARDARSMPVGDPD